MLRKTERRDTGVQSVSERLRRIAYAKGPDNKLPTVRELCLSLGTSRATIDNALNELETRNIIYRKQRSGIFVSSRIHEKSIGIILGSGHIHQAGASPFWDILWGTLIIEAHKRSETHLRNCSFHITNPSADPVNALGRHLSEMIENGRLDGALAIGLDFEVTEWILAHDLPLAAFASNGRWFVSAPIEPCFLQGVRALVDAGCRKIGVWSPVHVLQTSKEGQEREWALREMAAERARIIDDLQSAFSGAGAAFDPSLIRVTHGAAQSPESAIRATHQEQGYQTVLDVFRGPEELRPDGILFTDDMMACGALHALIKLGIQPGRDVKSVTHCIKGSPVLFGHEEDITALIEVDPEAIVAKMFDLLDLLMSGQKPADLITVVQPRLRTSSGYIS